MDFGWVITPQSRAGLKFDALMQGNRKFLNLIRGEFQSAWVEDHFQWEDHDTLECWTTLTFLAAEYRELDWGTLVLGQSYRNPALVAKMAAVLQNLTNGRLVFGIGAGWKEDEYRAYGWDYSPARERIEQLAEAVQLTRALWTQTPATFRGKYYSVENAYCEPKPNPLPPLMIGGNGDQTLRVAAQYADWWNAAFPPPEKFARLSVRLDEHCASFQREPASLRKTLFAFVSVNEDAAKVTRRDDLHVVAGSADQVTRELERYRALGADYFILRVVDFPETQGLELFLERVAPRL